MASRASPPKRGGTIRTKQRTPTASERTSTLRSLLSGGDRRSLAQARRALALVHRDPKRYVPELAKLADEDGRPDQDAGWLVSMRAIDLLEKLAHENVAWVEPVRSVFLGHLADSDSWEIRLQIVRALPLFAWSGKERVRAVKILRRDLKHPQKFVRTWALDSLATFALADRRLRRDVERALLDFEDEGSKSLVARARIVRERLNEAGAHGESP